MGSFPILRRKCYPRICLKNRSEVDRINNVLAIKHERIVIEEDKKKFAKADTCWICKGKFDINIEEIKRLENKIVSFKEKLEKFDKKSAEYNGIQSLDAIIFS